MDDFFHIWQNSELFSVLSAARLGLYPAIPSDWSTFEAPTHLCVPTPTTMAYVAGNWLLIGRVESVKTERTRVLVHAIMLSKWAVLAFL